MASHANNEKSTNQNFIIDQAYLDNVDPISNETRDKLMNDKSKNHLYD